MSRAPLSGLSDRELLGRLKSLVEKERTTTLEILVHLSEVEKRKLHLTLGYPSLFEYCTHGLGYSSSGAGRRIHAARCTRDFPEVLALLEKNQVHLSSVCLVAPILTEANKDDLLSRIRNKSQKEVEGIVADYRPPVSFRDRAKPVCVAVPEDSKKAPVVSEVVVTPHSRSGSEISPSVAAGSAGGQTGPCNEPRPSVPSGHHAPKPLSTPPGVGLERKLLVQFLASEAFMKKLEEARALLSNKLGRTSYETVLDAALEAFLERHTPGKKIERRGNRKRPDRAAPRSRKRVAKEADTCHIPARVRGEVFTRDKGRCTYKGPSGKCCGSTHDLQIDHIVPFGRGGTSAASNLRLLCAQHNRLEAERVYGANAITRHCRRE